MQQCKVCSPADFLGVYSALTFSVSITYAAVTHPDRLWPGSTRFVPDGYTDHQLQRIVPFTELHIAAASTCSDETHPSQRS